VCWVTCVKHMFEQSPLSVTYHFSIMLIFLFSFSFLDEAIIFLVTQLWAWRAGSAKEVKENYEHSSKSLFNYLWEMTRGFLIYTKISFTFKTSITLEVEGSFREALSSMTGSTHTRLLSTWMRQSEHMCATRVISTGGSKT
jgi:hypothetical protein